MYCLFNEDVQLVLKTKLARKRLHKQVPCKIDIGDRKIVTYIAVAIHFIGEIVGKIVLRLRWKQTHV